MKYSDFCTIMIAIYATPMMPKWLLAIMVILFAVLGITSAFLERKK